MRGKFYELFIIRQIKKNLPDDLFSCTQGAVRAQKKYKKCRKKHSTTCPPYTLHSSRVSEQEIVKAALFVK